MDRLFCFAVAIASLCFVGLVGFAQTPVLPPCFEVAQAATKDCLPHMEKACPTFAPNDPNRIKNCNKAVYESKPNRFPSTIVQAASGTTHEATAECWYSQPCLWQVIVHGEGCDPNTNEPETWTYALELQADNEVLTCFDPNFEPAPEL